MKYMINESYERNDCPAERRIETTFKKVCNFSTLVENMQRCKRKVSYKNSVARFDTNCLSKCYELYQELQEGTYDTKEGQSFEIYEPKYRIVTATKIKDRVVQSSFCKNVIYEEIVPCLIQNNCSCLKGRGVEFARNHFKEMLRKSDYNSYVLKMDLKDYFGSIKHDILINYMSRYFKDEKWVRWYYSNVINSNHKDKGIGLGSEVNQLSAVIFLNDIDHIIKGKYIRYMDDILYIGTKEECFSTLETIKKELAKLELTLSIKKTYIQPIKRPISFLGFRFLLKPTKRITMKKIKSKLNNEKRKLKKMVGNIPDDRLAIHYQCVRAGLKKGNRSTVIKLDNYLKELKNARNLQEK